MRRRELHFAECIFGTLRDEDLVGFTSGCEPRNSLKVTCRWMELFQSGVFLPSGTQITTQKKMYPPKRDEGGVWSWRKGWSVPRPCPLPLISRLLWGFTLPLGTRCPTSTHHAHSFSVPVFCLSPSLLMVPPPLLSAKLQIFGTWVCCILPAIFSIPPLTAVHTALLEYLV